jgi:DNA-binding NarL/FixJ family response regulator
MTARLLVAVIAGLTIIANMSFGVGWQLAVTAGVVVAAVGELAGRLVRAHQVPEATSPAQPPTSPGAFHPLSPREFEVAVLIAEGLTSKEAGRKLFIERGTVDTHVQHIYNKLGIDSRQQLVIWLIQRGLISAGMPEMNSTKHK